MVVWHSLSVLRYIFFIGFNYIEKSLSIWRGNWVQKNRKKCYYLNCIERVYPKWLTLFVHITTIRNFFFFEQRIFCGAIKILNTAISDHRYYFTSLLQILSSGGFPKQNSWLLNLSLSLFPRQDMLARTSLSFPPWVFLPCDFPSFPLRWCPAA